MKTKRFHLGEVLSITTGRLLGPRKMAGVYDIMNFLTSDNLFTHQLPRAAKECAPYLRKQFPALAAETGEEITRENHEQWLASAAEQYGEWFDVAPMPAHAHEYIDPLSELAEKVHPDKIIVVKP